MENVSAWLIGHVVDKHSSVLDTDFTVMFDELATLHYENSSDWRLLARTCWVNPLTQGLWAFSLDCAAKPE